MILSSLSCLLNTSGSFHSFHLLFALHFRILLFSLFVCKYLAFTFIPLFHKFYTVCEIFIHEVKLENDRAAVETSFLFFIARFYN